jgi:hypothetical protein
LLRRSRSASAEKNARREDAAQRGGVRAAAAEPAAAPEGEHAEAAEPRRGGERREDGARAGRAEAQILEAQLAQAERRRREEQRGGLVKQAVFLYPAPRPRHDVASCQAAAPSARAGRAKLRAV